MSVFLKMSGCFLCILLLNSCNLEKEIEIEIPYFENGYVVESYLSPDDDFGMLITNSHGFFEVFDASQLDPEQITEFLVQGANGYIEVNGDRYPLVNEIKILPGTARIYNYQIQGNIEFKENDEIELSLTFPTGEQVVATTSIPETRLLDSVRIDIDTTQDLEASETTFIYSDSTTTEYFRRQLFRIQQGLIEEIQDFILDNSIAKGGKLAFGSGNEFAIGDTLISRVTHIDKDYNDFFLSVSGSVNANTNPFGQPGRIVSNIHGSDRVIGIFTGINQSEILVKIKQK